MNVLELFAGSRSVGNVAEELGHTVFSSDIYEFDGIDYAINILKFDYSKVPFVPDVIWASPPCTGFSVASIGHHWTKGHKTGQRFPKTETAQLGIDIAKKTIEIINHFKKLNPKLIFFIENPRGMLRKMDFIAHIPRKTVTYCQYGDTRQKPTDIWTNSKKWKPKPTCKSGASCHIPAPRGSKTGTQGLKDNYERSKIPEELCNEILKVSELEYK